MHSMIKSSLKYFLVAGVFGISANLIYLAVPIFMMVVYDRVLFSFSTATLTTMIIGVLICLLAMGLLEYFRMRLAGQMIGKDLAKELTCKALESMYKAAGHHRSGSNRALEDLERLRNAISQGQVLMLLDFPWILLFLILLFLIHPLVGGVATAAILMAALFQLLLVVLESKRQTIADVAFQSNIDFAKNCLQRTELVAGLGMLPRIQTRYRERDEKIQALRSEADRFYALLATTIRIQHLVAVVAVFTAGVYVYFSEQITTGVIFAMVLITARIFIPLERSLTEMKSIIQSIAAYKRLRHYLDFIPPIEKLSLPELQGRLTAESLSLALNGKTVVHNISFSLEPGESLGILGPSTAGKSSLCKLLLGIFTATAGRVRLDGAEIAHWPCDQFHNAIGYLSQDSELFPVSIAENIAQLMPVDAERVVAAAQKAGVHEMILKLPQGYDTLIDQTGKNLASGQRQLIALARVFYNEPRLVVLDEPQTHLDEIGFRMLLHMLHTLKMEHITFILVTDRTNLITQSDKLLVMNDGQAVLYGPSNEVLTELAKRQQSQQAAGA